MGGLGDPPPTQRVTDLRQQQLGRSKFGSVTRIGSPSAGDRRGAFTNTAGPKVLVNRLVASEGVCQTRPLEPRLGDTKQTDGSDLRAGRDLKATSSHRND